MTQTPPEPATQEGIPSASAGETNEAASTRSREAYRWPHRPVDAPDRHRLLVDAGEQGKKLGQSVMSLFLLEG